jgi:hypothetical protein
LRRWVDGGGALEEEKAKRGRRASMVADHEEKRSRKKKEGEKRAKTGRQYWRKGNALRESLIESERHGSNSIYA